MTSAARGGLLVGAGILASRLVGLVRQRVVAHYLGTGDAADALAAAFRVGNITQNLLGEGALSASFIPVYARLREAEGQPRATAFARAALGALAPVALAVSALGVLAAPALAALVGSGFTGDKLRLAASLIRVLFPMTGALVVGAWALGVLNTHKRLFLPYAAPVVWSVAQIVAVVLAASREGATPAALATAVAWGALGGALLQVAVMLAPVRGLLGAVAPRLDLADPGVREAASKLPASLMGRGVMQLSALVDTAMVGTLGAGAVASVTYAQTIYLLPMALLGTGEAAASLPELARRGVALDDERRQEIRASLGAQLGRVVPLAAGAATAFLATGAEITTLLLRGGRFDQASTREVTHVLMAYALALPPNAASRVLSTACYALGDTAGPARFASVRVAVSTLTSLALLRPFGAPGVVFGSVVGAWVELALLAGAVRAKVGGAGGAQLPYLPLWAACAVCASFAAIARYFAVRWDVNVYLAAVAVLAFAGTGFAGACEALGVVKVRALLRRRG
ncbi:MAG: murein biosynthesis integral membrane protein MurJ [Polyangiales bacterium]